MKHLCIYLEDDILKEFELCIHQSMSYIYIYICFMPEDDEEKNRNLKRRKLFKNTKDLFLYLVNKKQVSLVK